MICLKNINKYYKLKSGQNFHALKNIDLKFNRGEFICIVGRSGSGKSSLLNIIGGLDQYDQGDLIIDNINTKTYHEIDWNIYRNKNIGFIFQSFNLIYHLTVLENVELPLIVTGNFSFQECRNKAIEVLEKVGLKEHIYKKPGYLSGGEQQRVAIARAIVNDPEIILADEPTGQLDKNTSIEILDLIKKISNNKLVIMVTHMEKLVSNYATRLITIKDGGIINDNFIESISNTKNFYDKNKKLKKLSNFKQLNYMIINNLKRRIKSTISLFIMFGLILSLALTAIVLGRKQVQNDVFYLLSPNSPLNLIRISHNEGFNDNEIIQINHLNNVISVTPYYNDNINIEYDDKNLNIISNLAILPEKEENFILKNEIIYGNYSKNNDEVIMTIDGAIKLIDDDNKTINQRYKLGLIQASDIWNELKNKTLDIKYNSEETFVKIVGLVDYNLWHDKEVLIFGKNELAKEIFNIDSVNYLSIYLLNVDNKSRESTKLQILKLNSSYIFDQSIETQITEIYNSFIPINNFVEIILIITLVITSICAFALINFNLYSRLKEVGILKSFGCSIQKIKMLFTLELLYIVLFGCIVYYFITTLFINIYVKITTQLFSTANININSKIIYPDFLSTVMILVIGLILIHLYSFIPLKKITKYPVIDILRES